MQAAFVLCSLRGICTERGNSPVEQVPIDTCFTYTTNKIKIRMKKIVLLRHGESAWNKENRFTGWTDVDLTERRCV